MQKKKVIYRDFYLSRSLLVVFYLKNVHSKFSSGLVAFHDGDQVSVSKTNCHELLLCDVTLVVDIDLAEENLRLLHTLLLCQFVHLKLEFYSRKQKNITMLR